MLNMQKDRGVITNTPTPQKNIKQKPIETGEADEPTIISDFFTLLQSVSFLCHAKIPEFAYKGRRFALAHSFQSFSLWSLDSLLWVCDGQNSRVKIAEDCAYYSLAAGSRDKQERAGLPAAPQRHTPDLTSFNRAAPPLRCHSLLIAA